VAVLLISGYPRANELDDIDVPFLKKPFHPAALATRVRQVLDRKAVSKKV
jgi:DNA-binding response OmpR family regulator